MSDHLTDEEVSSKIFFKEHLVKPKCWSYNHSQCGFWESYCKIARWMWKRPQCQRKLQIRRLETVTTEDDNEEVVAGEGEPRNRAQLLLDKHQRKQTSAWCNRIFIAWHNIFCLATTNILLWSDCLAERNWLWHNRKRMNAWPLLVEI
jgi:hypothetical protein